MNTESDDEFEEPALVEEMGLLEGHELVKSPPLLPPVESLDEPTDEER